MTASFAGYTTTARLSVDPFGELWAATGPDGKRAQLRRIDPALAHVRPFASALLKHGERLAGLEHPNLVGTIAVGHDDDDALVLVQEDQPHEPVTLETVLKDARLSGAHASTAVALHIVRQVVKALARLHRAGAVHGGVHPRSVVIDKRGEVRLTDAAVARALAAAATQDDSLLRGLLGYVAPEIALGDEPGPRADVFSAAALLTELLTGSPPPGLIEGPPALVEACRRALHTDAEERYPDATELAMALDGAAAQLEQDPDARAVVRYVAESHGGANRSLDAETENLLAGLDIVADVSAADVAPLSPAALYADDDGDAPGRDHTPLPPPVPLGRDETRPSDSWMPLAGKADSDGVRMPDLDASLLGAGAAQLGKRRRDSAPMRVQTADVISEQLVTPLSLPLVRPPSGPAPLPLPAMPSVRTLSPTDETMMAPPVRPGSPSRTAPPRSEPATFAAGASPRFAGIDSISDLAPPRPPKSSRTLWLVAVASVALVGLVVWKSGVLNPRTRSDEELAAKDQVAAAERGAEVSRTRYADVVIDSDVPGAAVWMNLGKTPVDSLPLSSAGIYELRVQQDGMKASDVVVTPGRWTGAGENMTAAMKVALEPAPIGYVAPAAPPHAPAAQEVPADKAGRGRIHIDSDPAGAQVWLLVGFTPQVTVKNLAADKNHEFKVMLDGRVPAFAEVLATDFMDPSGQAKNQVHEVKKSVVLKPRPKDGAARPRANAKEKDGKDHR